MAIWSDRLLLRRSSGRRPLKDDGCGSFLQNAPPGKPSEFPGESVAERKARTKGETKPAARNTKGQARSTPSR
jgi:hypothetical protein